MASATRLKSSARRRSMSGRQLPGDRSSAAALGRQRPSSYCIDPSRVLPGLMADKRPSIVAVGRVALRPHQPPHDHSWSRYGHCAGVTSASSRALVPARSAGRETPGTPGADRGRPGRSRAQAHLPRILLPHPAKAIRRCSAVPIFSPRLPSGGAAPTWRARPEVVAFGLRLDGLAVLCGRCCDCDGGPRRIRVVVGTPDRLTVECWTVGVIGDLQAHCATGPVGTHDAALRPV